MGVESHPGGYWQISYMSGAVVTGSLAGQGRRVPWCWKGMNGFISLVYKI